jgi:peptide/nickel transport system substrate-binding protein
MKIVLAVLGLAIAVSAAGQALADKKSGILNVALKESHSGIDEIQTPGGEVQVMARAVQDRLMNFDGKTRTFIPSLAKSWRQIDDKTWEFTLRDDVLWHDGQKFTAEDVAYTINHVVDYRVKLLQKTRFTWMSRAEAIDPTRVRIFTTDPTASALASLAINLAILPKHIHDPLANKATFGKSVIGTGPYRLTSFDENAGLKIEVNKNFRHANHVRPAAQVDRIHLATIPDEQTSYAKLLVGEVDLTAVFGLDIAENLAKNPNLATTATNSFRYYYMGLDAATRSGLVALSDVRVRKAIGHAINYDQLRKSVIAGGDLVLPLDAPCLPKQFGCDVSTPPARFDPARARALLAEAGYKDGIELSIWTLRIARQVADAVSGYLRQVGIRANVREVSFAGYNKDRSEGLMQSTVFIYGSGGVPDVSAVMAFFFEDSPRDYAQDMVLKGIAATADRMLDDAKRNEIYRNAFNRNNEQAYVIPIASVPTIFVHTKDLAIPVDFATNGFGVELETLRWK